MFKKRCDGCGTKGNTFPRGGLNYCAKCKRVHDGAATKVATVAAPFTCKCGRRVTNSQGICPGPDC